MQHSARFGGGVVDRGGFSGGQVDDVDAAGQPDGVGAGAGGGELAFPLTEVRPRDGVVGGRPRPRAERGFGTEGGCRGSGQWLPQRCWAAWRVMPSLAPMSAQE